MTREGTRLGIDVEGQANGSNQTVFITTPEGGTAEVLTVGDDYWVGGDEALLGSRRPVTRRPRRPWSASTRRSPSPTRPSSGSFTLRTILTDLFALPELAAAGVGHRRRRRRTRSTAGRPTCSAGKGGPRLWVAADGSGTLLRAVGAEERAGRSQLHRLGPRRDVHRAAAGSRSSRTDRAQVEV